MIDQPIHLNKMEVFFYGLFMDRSLLLTKGIKPSNPRKAYLDNYALKIGNRASLIPCAGERAYGIVMTIDQGALDDLYAEASVADYLPEKVTISTDTRETIEAICYNLPEELITGTNTSYAQSLYTLVKREGFPDEYLWKIKEMAGSQ